MTGIKERLQRRWLPRLVVALARRQRARPLPAAAAIELYFACDDPCAAIALPALAALAAERGVPLQLYPLIARGIGGDPAADARARHAVRDADRLARRGGRQLSRRSPLAAADTAFLAGWIESLRGTPAMVPFAIAVIEQLWLVDGDTPPAASHYAPLFHRMAGHPAPSPEATQPSLAANHRRLRRLGHWESPAARIGGEWFFAHERLAQIGECLDRRKARA
ncbi:MAG: hypothetical protein C0434_14445 [Xanthomonadaceae bacterium]|nr:hypothetical protein [Xanthomonadaceae bacterium]